MAAWRVVRSAIQMVCFVTAGLAGSVAMASGLMTPGGYTSQPIGHYEFCKSHPFECAIRSRDNGPLVMNDAWRATIEHVNLAVNREVRPMNDRDIYGKEEHWAYPVSGVGDCEDYVLEKRKRLHAMGIPLSNLLITVVRKPDGEGHAVLTVRTTDGDLILDNLSDEVKLWSWTSYEFLKRQSTNHTGRWVSLQDANNLLVGAVQK